MQTETAFKTNIIAKESLKTFVSYYYFLNQLNQRLILVQVLHQRKSYSDTLTDRLQFVISGLFLFILNDNNPNHCDHKNAEDH